ncbi:MAG: hypothetical protein ABL931_23210 [Usitatibacteraceae bacterium]
MLSKERRASVEHYQALDLDGLLAMVRDRSRDVDLLILIGQHFFRRQQLPQCGDYYFRALKIDPDDGWTHLYIGNLCYGLSCHDEAEMHFRKAVELLPGVACPHWCLASVYEKQGYWTRTELHYRKAVEIDPFDTKSKQMLEDWLANKPKVNKNGLFERSEAT